MKKDIRKFYCMYKGIWGHIWILYEPNKRTDICFKSNENQLTIIDKSLYNKLK